MECRIEDSLSDEAYALCCQPLEVGLATCGAVGLAKAEARRAPQPGRWRSRKDDDENDDDWFLPDSVGTEEEEAGASCDAEEEEDPIHGLSWEAQQEYYKPQQNADCCRSCRKQPPEMRFVGGVYIGCISDRENQGQEK
jgi:hypothetical protein